jgi:hypothetical protein
VGRLFEIVQKGAAGIPVVRRERPRAAAETRHRSFGVRATGASTYTSGPNGRAAIDAGLSGAIVAAASPAIGSPCSCWGGALLVILMDRDASRSGT